MPERTISRSPLICTPGGDRRRPIAVAWLAAALLSTAWVLPTAAEEPPGGVDSVVEALVEEALGSHPVLAAARSRAEAASEVPSRVSSPPDPWLSFGASNLRVDAPGLDTSPMSGLVLGLNQGLPFPGRLARRRDLAAAGEELAMARVLSTETQVALRVRERYWGLYLAERSLAITEESAAVLDGLANAVTARFSVGEGAQQDALQVQVAEARVRSMLQARQEGVRTARRALARAVGRSPEASFAEVAAPPEFAPRDAEETRRRLLEANPQLAAARREVEVADAAVAEAKSALAPDLGAGVSWRIRGVVPGDASAGADMFSAGLSLSLPVWAATKQTAAIRERRARRVAAAGDEADLLLALESELGSLLDARQRLDEELRIHLEQLSPQSDQALSASIEDYAVGRVGFVSVLQNWRVALDVQLAVETLRSSRARVEARIDAITGIRTRTEEN